MKASVREIWPVGFFVSGAIAVAAALLPFAGFPGRELFLHSILFVYWLLLFLVIQMFFVSGSLLYFKKNVTPFFVSFFLTGIIFFSVGPSYRVLADETNLVSTSFGLARYGELKNITESIYIMGKETVLSSPMAHRPGLFAFLVSIVHSITGFHHWNVFIVNFFVSVASLFLLIQFFTRAGYELFGYLVAILTASFPLYMLVMTSGGFDGLNFLMLLVYLFLFREFVKNPTTTSLYKFFFFAALAGHARYESALLFPLAFVFLFAFLYFNGIQLRKDGGEKLLLLVPFISVPLVWQRLYSGRLANAGDSDAIAMNISYIAANAMGAVNFFLNRLSETMPTSLPVVILFLAGLPFLLFLYFKKEYDSESGIVETGLLTFVSLFFIILVHLTFYHGNISWPWVMRLGMVYLPVMIPVAALVLLRMFLFLRIKKTMLLVLAGFLFLSNLSIASMNEKGNTLTLSRKYNEVMTFLENRYPEDDMKKHVLVVSDRPGMYTARGFSAVKYNRIKESDSDIRKKMKAGFFKNVIWIQDVKTASGIGKPEESPPEDMENVKLLSSGLTYGSLIVISEVSERSGPPVIESKDVKAPTGLRAEGVGN